MNCNKIKKYLDDYILGEIDTSLEIKINEHLLECAHCRQQVNEKESFFASFKESAKFIPPEQTYQKIAGSVFRPDPRKKPFLAGWSWRFAYTVAAFFAGMVLMRIADTQFNKFEEQTEIEVKYEPTYRVPFSDTVLFYTAPPKNLAKI